MQLFRPKHRRDRPAASLHAGAVGKGRARLLGNLLTGIVVPALALGVLASGLLLRGWAPAEAQQADRATISVAPTTQVEPASRTRLAIQVGPREAVTANSFIRMRGLPPTVALSEGHVIAPGSWAIPLSALPNLTIILPIGLQGQSDIAISLVSVDGTVLAEAKTQLVVAAAPPRPSVQEAQSPPPPPIARVVPMLNAADRERALGFHAKGQEQLERGSIYAARKFFERAADIGLAQSAVALADTYDPEELRRLRVVGIQPDVAAAKKWYERARELGATEASDRLRRLGSR